MAEESLLDQMKEHYGIEKMQSVIRQHVADAARLAAELQKRDDVELIAPQSLSVVVFRKIVRNNGVIDEDQSVHKAVENTLMLAKPIGPNHRRQGTLFKRGGHENGGVIKVSIETVILIIRLRQGKKHIARLDFA